MSDTMSQAQVDAMIRDFLPDLDPVDTANTPICPKCKTSTKRMVFGSNYPTRIKVVSGTHGVMLAGVVPANGIFCFSCGSFFDHVDRSKRGLR